MLFAQDETFWDTYLKGRPKPPDAFFDRIFTYHEAHSGQFGTVHDVGAGNGPYAQRLRSRFVNVIVSDIVPANVELARARLRGLDGFTFRAAKLEDEVNDIPPGSVDMIFATNVMHFPNRQDAAVAAIARQLRPGGTFAAATFGPARFHDPEMQDLWDRISREGGRRLLGAADDPETTAKIMARTRGTYNHGGIQPILPPEAAHLATDPDFTGPDDVETFEEEEGWGFEMDLSGVKEHFGSFPFVSKFPGAFKELYEELDALLADGRRVGGTFLPRSF
ncbi:hypothetical protein PG997_005758 [Apiospora hydei]|uniref:Methyltransferase type 11 domain-containing protein n=1 Tax=Apiospora hydei TaxID=1337664 RepID=A0ABR1WN91_9PEZI